MTDTEQKTETLEEIAMRIVDERLDEMMSPREYGPTRGLLIIDFVQALRNERDRAAKICEQGAMLASPVGVIPAGDQEHERLQRLADVLSSAAKAIREGR